MCRSPQSKAGLEDSDVITIVGFQEYKILVSIIEAEGAIQISGSTLVCIQVYKTETVGGE